MLRVFVTLAAAAASALTATAAGAQDKVKIGIITTLSGPPAVLGQQQRNGFQLAVKKLGGKLGGRDAEVLVAGRRAQARRRRVQGQGLRRARQGRFRGRSGLLQYPDRDHQAGDRERHIPDQPNAGTSNFAGKECNPNLFVTSYQNDQVHEVLGKYAQDTGLKTAFLMAPNYQAGKDAIAGFKRYYQGRDCRRGLRRRSASSTYSAELSKIAAAKPDAVFMFLPGGMGVNFVKQYRQAGLRRHDQVPVGVHRRRSRPCRPSRTRRSASSAARTGRRTSTTRRTRPSSPPTSKEYNAVPATYAFQAYDAAMLIDSALKATKGDTSNKDALRAALMKADFKSLRGNFKFNTNHYPIQDFYLVKVGKRPDGKYETEIVQKVFADYGDGFVHECAMK